MAHIERDAAGGVAFVIDFDDFDIPAGTTRSFHAEMLVNDRLVVGRGSVTANADGSITPSGIQIEVSPVS